MNKTRGGARPNSGPKKGTSIKTIAKEQTRELVRQIIAERLEPLLEAQIAKAMSVSHFLVRDPVTKQFRRISDPDEIQRAIDSEEEHYRIYTKDPNLQAFTDLMNRALDKPSEQVQIEQNMNVRIHAEIRSKIQEALIREEHSPTTHCCRG